MSSHAPGSLAALRHAARLSQRETALRMGVGQTRVSAIENSDMGTLTVATLTAYLNAVGQTLRITTASGHRLHEATAETETAKPDNRTAH